MKRFIFCFMLCIVIQCVHAQTNLVPNPGFENASGHPGPLDTETEINNNLHNWRVDYRSSEDPNPIWVKNASKNLNAHLLYDGYNCSAWGQDSYLAMQAQTQPGVISSTCNCSKIRHDHIAVHFRNGYLLDPNIWYVIRYKIVPKSLGLHTNPVCTMPSACQWTLSYAHMRIFASVGGPLNWRDNGNVMEELLSANWQGGTSPDCNWQLVERRFKVTTSGLGTLAFYVETGGFFLDDIEVFEECESNYLISNKTYDAVNSSTYATLGVEGHNMKDMSGSEITVGANVGGTNGVGNVEVTSNAYLIYTAPNAITFKPGFAARNGSHLHAVNAGCPNAIMWKTDVVKNRVGLAQDILPNHEDEEALEEQAEVVRSVVYPNPVKDKFTYTLIAKKGDSKLVICNILGQQMFESMQTVSGQETSIDVSTFTSGIYFLNEYDEQGKLIAVSKIIKE